MCVCVCVYIYIYIYVIYFYALKVLYGYFEPSLWKEVHIHILLRPIHVHIYIYFYALKVLCRYLEPSLWKEVRVLDWHAATGFLTLSCVDVLIYAVYTMICSMQMSGICVGTHASYRGHIENMRMHVMMSKY